jgi:TetR/AcrR family transcriptional repressor of nem operon
VAKALSRRGGAGAEPVTPKGRRAREALLEAGAAVAERAGVGGLTVAEVARAAGLAKGTFYLYFPDREAFIDALHQRFYARVTEAIMRAVEGLEPGVERVVAANLAYLDACLENLGAKALVLETRNQPNLTETMEDRQELFAKLAAADLRAIGVANPDVTARMIVAMTSEASLIELRAGRRTPAARKALRGFIESLG